jgi:cholesterol oxidase
MMAASAVGFTFTETMGGFLGRDDADFRRATAKGLRAGEKFRFKLTILADDLGEFLANPAHEAPMRGTVDSTSLGQGLEVQTATFNLLERDENGRLWMKYRLEFTSDGGVPYVLEGFKDVQNNRMIDFWYDTTALFTDVKPAAEDSGEPSFHGILRIRPIDLVPQVISMRGLHTRNPARHALALARFGWFFFFTLVKEYARPPRRAQPEASTG